jgi:large subunit ribosomal protein L13
MAESRKTETICYTKKRFKMKTYTVNDKDIQADWKLIDAEGKAFGRVATEAARMLRGKHKAIYSPNADCGDHVVIINAEKAVFTGRKAEQKTYFRHTGYIGNEIVTSFENAIEKDPTFPMEHAVKGMLPKTALGDKLAKKLHIYAGAEHKHGAQKPELVNL